MPKVSVYLPDDLYDEARRLRIPISTVTQEAVTRAIKKRANAEWIEHVRTRRPRVTKRIDTSALVSEVRDEFGT